MTRRRGQTTLDFAIGMSIFLLAVIFVLTFVPGMLEPFQSGPHEATVVTDRIASQLVGSTLTDGGSQYLLNTTCTLAFFNTSYDDAGCGFDNSRPVADRLGTDMHVNVTVKRDFDGDGTAEPACWYNDQVTDCADGWQLAAGDSGGAPRSVVVARRVAALDSLDVEVLVRVW